MARAAVLDVDGTLIDANYQHVLAWHEAFSRSGIVVPLRRIHRHVGMGGDQLVPSLIGEEAEARQGDEIRDARDAAYEKLIDGVQPFAGAAALLRELKQRGLTVVLASSSPDDEIDHYLDLLEAREAVDAWTTKDDVGSTKPQPDLVHVALEKAGTEDAVMVGDTVWDIEAAKKAGLDTLCVLSGGAYSEQELLDAGAAAVFESAEELRRRLDETPLAAA